MAPNSSLSRRSNKPLMMPPAKDKEITQKKRKNYNDTFKDLGEADYRHVIAGKSSLFSKILTKNEMSKTPAECSTCWDRLRTRNFQIAGDWYLRLRFASDEMRPWGKSDVSAAIIRGELEKGSEYLATRLSDCVQLSPLEAAARYVWFIAKKEGQDPKSFIHDIRGVGKRIVFVVDLFLSCKFGADTHTHALTKVLFPLTRQGDWRRKHLFSSQERSKKRSSDSISKDGKDFDSEIGAQIAIDEGQGDTDQEEGSTIAEVQPQLKRTRTFSSDRKITPEMLKVPVPSCSFTPVQPPMRTEIKFADATSARDLDASPLQAPATKRTGFRAPATAVTDFNSPSLQPNLQASTLHIASPVSNASRELQAPTMSPISPQENTRVAKWIVASDAKPRQSVVHSSSSATPEGLSNPRQDSRRLFCTNVPLASTSTILEVSGIDSGEQTRTRRQIEKLEQEALDREKVVAKLRKRTAEQDDEIRENEERIRQLVAERAEGSASLAERARIIADQDQKLRHFQAQTDCSLAGRTQQVAQLEQEGAQKDRLVERLRTMLSDVAEQIQESLNEIKCSWGMDAVEKLTR
jgi:hypothetical protein